MIKNCRDREEYFFNGCECQDFDSFLLQASSFFFVGCNDEVFLCVCLLVHHLDRLPLMVSCLVPMNSCPTCPWVWLLLEQVPILGLTQCVQGQTVKTGLSKWEFSEKSSSQVSTPFYCG